MLELTVVVPVRNAEGMIAECLASIVRAEPREIIVVDGLSTDRTVEIARQYPVHILSDEGRGVAAARALGVQAATSRWVALIDADIVLPDGSLQQLFAEYQAGGYTALQFGLESTSGPGYWGRAVVDHHRHGRSKSWPGVMGTIFERATLLEHGFDQTFLSGEDIELRWRLQRAGARLGVSRRTNVNHRYGDTYAFALGQWLADGQGLARMVYKHGWRAGLLLGLPFAACGRGILLSLARVQLTWIPYYICYMIFNYVGILRELRKRGVALRPMAPAGRL
jgi:glycosyltransferase involved in cell wall biosynthesis